MSTPYLLRRGATWYARIRTPSDLRGAIGTHVVRTLRTGDLAIARGRALRVAAGMPRVWKEMRDEAAKVLGRGIDEFGHEEMLRCYKSPSDKNRLLSDFDALSGEDRKRLLVRMKFLLDESTREVDALRSDVEFDRAIRGGPACSDRLAAKIS